MRLLTYRLSRAVALLDDINRQSDYNDNSNNYPRLLSRYLLEIPMERLHNYVRPVFLIFFAISFIQSFLEVN